jgi:hypothetical protein
MEGADARTKQSGSINRGFVRFWETKSLKLIEKCRFSAGEQQAALA